MPNVILMAPLQNLELLKLLQNQNCNSLSTLRNAGFHKVAGWKFH